VFPGESQIKGVVSQGAHRESQHTLVESQDSFPKSQVESDFQVYRKLKASYRKAATANRNILLENRKIGLTN